MNRIDIKLPFIYTAEVKKPGKRNFETVEFGDWTEVSVPILSESEAPIAARWVSNNQVGDQFGKVIERRYADDKFWLPSWEKNTNEGPISIDRLASKDAYLEGKHPFLNYHPSTLRKFVEGTLQTGTPRDYREYRYCNRQEQIDSIEQKARSFVFINDELWTTIWQPVLSLEYQSASCDLAFAHHSPQ